MALKLRDLIIKDVWNVAGFDVTTQKPLFNLVHCNNTELAVTANKTEITGGRGAPVLAVFQSEVKAELSVESATFDLGLLALQTGDTDGIFGQNVSVPYTEKITIDPSGKATLQHTPSIEYIMSVILDDGTVLVESPDENGPTETSFTVASKNLTFTEDYAGLTGSVFYETIATDTIDIVIDTKAPIRYCTIKAEITAENQCDGLNYMGYIIIPRASVSKDFTIASSSTDAAVQEAVFSAVQTCGNTELARIVIYDADKLG